jgi:hypothetical protein
MAAIQVTTMMRKLIGRLNGLTRAGQKAAAATPFQKTVLCIAVDIALPIFAIEMFTASWGLGVLIGKPLCWGCLLCNLVFHLGNCLRGVSAVFGTVATVESKTNDASAPGTVVVAANKEKMKKMKKTKASLQRNTALMVFLEVGLVGMLFWLPSAAGSDHCARVSRTTKGGMQERLKFGTCLCLLSQVN